MAIIVLEVSQIYGQIYFWIQYSLVSMPSPPPSLPPSLPPGFSVCNMESWEEGREGLGMRQDSVCMCVCLWGEGRVQKDIIIMLRSKILPIILP